MSEEAVVTLANGKRIIKVRYIGNNFSYHTIFTPIVIPQYQQMIVCSEITVVDELTLEASGELAVIGT